MILLDAPYVSDFLKLSVKALKLPVLDTPSARSMTDGADVVFIDTDEFTRRLASGERVYTNSENSLDLIIKAAGDSDLARQIEICKDKALFRETIADIHPDYQFLRATPDSLKDLDISHMPCPFVAKPARGFFSLGVHLVSSHDQWPETITAILAEQTAMNDEYPEEVVDGGEFIIEQGIAGEEYAIDVYYNGAGEPVITNILHHHFISEDDVSDRFYYTSPEIIRTWLEPFTDYVTRIGRVCEFRNFPIHLEVRVDAAGHIVPIEANPLRFAGWCVADITTHAWGFNPYEYYFKDMRPDWTAILKERGEEACGMIIGDVPAGIDRDTISHIDFDSFLGLFETVLELRKIDYTAYPLFAFVFAKMESGSMDAIRPLLEADFSRYISMNPTTG